MKRLLFSLVAVLVACEEPAGLRISESCAAYEAPIRAAVDTANALEGYEVVTVRGQSERTETTRQKDMNDEIDLVFCRPGWNARVGEAFIGFGDVYLYPDALARPESMPCVILHEFGHRYLELEDNDDPETIMYHTLTRDCLSKTRWE